MQTAAEASGGSIFTVPPGLAFLRTIAEAVLAGHLPRAGGAPPDALALAAMTILLPTRRAARALQQAFLDASSTRALVLPRIRPIAEGDEDLALLAALSGPAALGTGGADIPPAISEIERRLVLTRLVQQWSQAMRAGSDGAGLEIGTRSLDAAAGAGTAAQAAALAAELARLVDEVDTEGVDLSGLAGLVPDQYSAHWQHTLEFLRIILEWWPQHLAERGLLSPMDRRNRLVLAEAGRLAARPPAGPVIVAGVSGSIPATAELMRVVAGLPQGAIVLAGLDRELDAESRRAIVAPRRVAATAASGAVPPAPPSPSHPEHPQFGLERLIGSLGVERDDVQTLPGAEPPARIVARTRLVAQAMRPASTTGRWHDFTQTADRAGIAAALEGVSLIEAPTVEDEAEAIALMLREVAETPGRTAALVSRDRLLARRVAVRLDAWGIRVDDSAGRPLAKTMPGAFLDLVVEAAATGFAPAALVALVKHPLTRLGRPAGELRRTARALEIAAFRTLYIGRGLHGVLAALEAAERDVADKVPRGRAVRRLRVEDWAATRTLVEELVEAFAPLCGLLETRGPHELRTLVRAHVETAEALARQPEGDRSPGLWAEAAGEAASLLLTSLIDEELPSLGVPSREYPDLYRSLVARETVRPTISMHPRLSIWGPLEARLQQPDVVILGALNDGIWPEQVEPGPWLNRPMRQTLGLPSPEERIGYAAHDFSMLMGAPKVVMTRALKVDGVPAVASRWLLRLRALLDALGLGDALDPGEPWLGWAAWRNRVERRPALRAPEPRPPVERRPRRMSVSGVETWLANPYAVFAREILRLEPLPLLGAEPDAAMRGSVVHNALSDLAKACPDRLPDDVAGALMGFARKRLERLAGNPRVAAFWLLRLERFAQWFGETEAGRRQGVTRSLVEVSGCSVVDGLAGPFRLTARADRIDVTAAGIVITDYKTGSSLGKLRKDADEGFAPQLALEAAIALDADGGFDGLDAQAIADLRYISASGGEPPGQVVRLKAPDLAALAMQQRESLQRLVAAFDDVGTPYRATRRARFSYDYDDYAHLARVAEWAGGGEGGEGEGEGG